MVSQPMQTRIIIAQLNWGNIGTTNITLHKATHDRRPDRQGIAAHYLPRL